MLVRGLMALGVLVGGAWLVTDFVLAQPRERSGEQVVKMQCIKCHGTGVNGAPKIDDRAAWIPRMKDGVDATVRSAMKGHGKMPARGGVANLTDAELRAAILYMFYPAAASQKGAAPAPAAPDPYHKTVGGVDFYLGIAPADVAPVRQDGPRAKGYYYVNVSLHDAASKAYIKDAQVDARAANPVTGGETKKMERVAAGEGVSYGNFFRMEGAEPYTITVRAHRGKEAPLEVKFEFRP
ncbi:MAG TPA: c-type cytochrome [Burkholderiales bacterium]|nr:c-type cytochrome [Burkholderiales bacterium]